jgi:hypothetical protein
MPRALLLTALAALLASPQARAASGCPWEGQVTEADASMTMVYVNGELFYVRGLASRTAFKQVLLACGEEEAAYYFERWRTMRRWTNGPLIGGLILTPIWIASPFTALAAGGNKQLMLQALLSKEDNPIEDAVPKA